VLLWPRGPRAKGGGPDPPGGPDLARSDSLRFAPRFQDARAVNAQLN